MKLQGIQLWVFYITGVNTAIKSIRLEPGDVILYTDNTYRAVKNTCEATVERSTKQGKTGVTFKQIYHCFESVKVLKWFIYGTSCAPLLFHLCLLVTNNLWLMAKFTWWRWIPENWLSCWFWRAGIMDNVLWMKLPWNLFPAIRRLS